MPIKIFLYFLIISGLTLFTINIFGIFQDIRPHNIYNENLRFQNDQPRPYSESISKLNRKEKESDVEFTQRVTRVIARGLAHIHWEEYPPQKFNQLVPIWENYFLFLMGMYSGIPEYERYHFANYRRSLQRGIGICGDAAMVLSQVLSKNNIKNKILTYPEHVLVEANFSHGNNILDPDFGVSIPFGKEKAHMHSQEIAEIYTQNGYSKSDEIFFTRLYKQNYQQWNGIQHMITNKYYFEKLAYALKWPLPIFLMILGGGLLRFTSRKKH